MARYIPLVRTKAGEAEALGALSAAARVKTFPLVNMTATIPVTFLPNMIQRMAGRPIALDGSYNFAQTGTAAAFTALFNGLLNGGVPVIPAITYLPMPAYLAAVNNVLNANGLVLHISLADLPTAAAWVAAQGWHHGSVDLVVSAGGVSDHNPVQLGGYVQNVLNNYIAQNHPWRTVTLHSHSAPRDHANLPAGRSLVPRRDWLLWQNVAPNVPFTLDYSDSCHVHPSLEEVPGYAMARATVSVRYAIDDFWIVRKGVATTGQNGQPMSLQYRQHAQALVAEPQFDQLVGCWGDQRIQHYAVTPGGTGGRSQWAAVLLNRHVSLVADRLP